MATYPEGNPGVYPLDPSSTVGQFRLAYGDTESQPYDPVEPGFQNYDELSDAEIEVFLTQGGGLDQSRHWILLPASFWRCGQAEQEHQGLRSYRRPD